jgi:hypothetical protein
MQDLSDRGIERAADRLDKAGTHHGWWPKSLAGKSWRDYDPIGRSEYLGLVQELIRDYFRGATDEQERLASGEPHLTIDMTLYPVDRVGNATPIRGMYGFSCKFHQDDVSGWDAFVSFSGDQLVPGDTRRVGITFMTPIVRSLFRDCGKFYVWRDQVVGEAVPVFD